MYDLKDDPMIRSLELTGLPAWMDDDDDEQPVCPVCGAACDTAYIDPNGEPAGCDRCLRRADPCKDPRFFRKLARVSGW